MVIFFNLKLGWTTGVEPAASGVTVQRSSQLSYAHHKCKALLNSKKHHGTNLLLSYDFRQTPDQWLSHIYANWLFNFEKLIEVTNLPRIVSSHHGW